jgi:hypothetical protein
MPFSTALAGSLPALWLRMAQKNMSEINGEERMLGLHVIQIALQRFFLPYLLCDAE